jgi:hypothetical protein
MGIKAQLRGGQDKAAGMLKTDGPVPDLVGRRCDGLLVQQFWQHGVLADPADVVWLKLDGLWHQLYLDAGVVHWRSQQAPPAQRPISMHEVFRYPLVDLGAGIGLQGRVIQGYRLYESEDGETLVLDFGAAGTLELISRGDATQVRHRP